MYFTITLIFSQIFHILGNLDARIMCQAYNFMKYHSPAALLAVAVTSVGLIEPGEF